MIVPILLWSYDCIEAFVWYIMIQNLYKYVSYVINKNILQCLNIGISHLFTSTTCILLLNLGSQRNTPFDVQKSKLVNLFCYLENWRVVKIEYQSPSINTKGEINSLSLRLKKGLRSKSYMEHISLIRNKGFNRGGCNIYKIYWRYSANGETF